MHVTVRKAKFKKYLTHGQIDKECLVYLYYREYNNNRCIGNFCTFGGMLDASIRFYALTMSEKILNWYIKQCSKQKKMHF